MVEPPDAMPPAPPPEIPPPGRTPPDPEPHDPGPRSREPGDANGGGANRVLILFAHPALEKSRVNRHLVVAVRGLPGVTFHDLYEEYPEFDIDVAREQRLLVEHDVIVLHHPVFWYSTPALLKQWEDLVLEHGWAYGSTGTALAGKRILNVMTTGGREHAYLAEGYNRFTIRQFFTPIEQTFRLCGMDYLPPFVAHGTHAMTEERIRAHATDYRRLVEALRDDRIDWELARTLERLNHDLDRVVRSGDRTGGP